MIEVSVKFWGDFACFTRSDAKINRVSYDVPTPSACRGMLEAIYCKPIEFWYEIAQIKVLAPIRYMNVKKNEISKKADSKSMVSIDSTQQRTQRNTQYLRNVAYVITARIHVRDGFMPDAEIYQKEGKIREEFFKRLTKGKCFAQPYLGLRECMCFFEPVSGDECPIAVSKDLGVMLYDIFDPQNIEPLDTRSKKKSTTNITYFHPYMINGIINIPPYSSPEILRL